MALHWTPPPQGSLKINVHGTASKYNMDTGFATVYRDASGGLRHLTIGVIPEVTPLGNQLWAIFIALKRAFLEGYMSVIVETDNLTAFRIIRNFQEGAPTEVYDIVSQIDIRLNDPRWYCTLAYVFPAKNKVARYASRMVMELYDRTYTLDMTVGDVEELMDWDMGIGLDHPAFVDVVIPSNAPDPVDFGVAATITNQLENLGIGQVGASNVGPLDVEMNEEQGELNEVMGEIYQAGVVADGGFLYVGEALLEEVD